MTHKQQQPQASDYTSFRVRLKFWKFVGLVLMCYAFALVAMVLITGCAEHDLHGEASFYADKYHGRLAASEVVFSQFEMFAAHKTLPFGSIVRVYHRTTSDSCDVVIVDRGPFVPGRVIDLSLRAATQMKMLHSGHIPVLLKVVGFVDLAEWPDGEKPETFNLREHLTDG